MGEHGEAIKVKGNRLRKYDLEVDDLSDEDVQRVCDMYWMDYLCVPFEIPRACSLERMILEHYGSDFRYKECWSYETRKFDDGFMKRYKETDFTIKKKSKRKRRSRHRSRSTRNRKPKKASEQDI